MALVEADQVGEALRRHLEARFAVAVTIAAQPTAVTGGYDTRIYFAQFEGEGLPAEWQAPLALRVHPTPERIVSARREAAVQDFCVSAGYPAPKVLSVFEPGEVLDLPVQVMERIPGTTMMDALMAKAWRLPAIVREFGRLHAKLHALPIEAWPFPEEATSDHSVLASRRLALPRRVAATDGPEAAALQHGLDRLERALARLAVNEPVVCHGDFHPLNVLLAREQLVVIDWTDACLGDRHGDVARLLYLLREVRIANPGRAGRVLLRAVTPTIARNYMQGYQSVAPALDRQRLAAWEPVHLLHDWARAVLIASGPDGRARINPAVIPWIRAQLERALATLTG